MDSFQFIDIIILAMVAGFIVLRLRSVLGRRSGHEPDPRANGGFPAGPDNVVPVPLPVARRREATVLDIEPAFQGTPLEAGLVQLKMADPQFSVARFLEGGAKAFELIVAAYAKNDTDALKPLLSQDVYANFASSIQDREARGETLETELVVLKPPKLESVEVVDGRALVAVRFQSEQVKALRDKDGTVIEGSRDHVESVTDIWTFSRDTNSRDPNWVLTATRSLE